MFNVHVSSKLHQVVVTWVLLLLAMILALAETSWGSSHGIPDCRDPDLILQLDKIDPVHLLRCMGQASVPSSKKSYKGKGQSVEKPAAEVVVHHHHLVQKPQTIEDLQKDLRSEMKSDQRVEQDRLRSDNLAGPYYKGLLLSQALHSGRGLDTEEFLYPWLALHSEDPSEGLLWWGLELDRARQEQADRLALSVLK